METLVSPWLEKRGANVLVVGGVMCCDTYSGKSLAYHLNTEKKGLRTAIGFAVSRPVSSQNELAKHPF